MTDLRQAFRDQAAACAGLDSPFMAQLCRVLSERLTTGTQIADRLLAWTGNVGPSGDSVPLRLAGALHALHLQGRGDLSAVYPPNAATDDALWDAVSAAMLSETAFIDAWLDSPPQTNEVRRSAALIAAGHVIADRFNLPLVTSELGASGGLNLNWDRYALELEGQSFGDPEASLRFAPKWTGPQPPSTRPHVALRAGVDLNPLDPKQPADRMRLLAYLWADQPHRLTLTQAAIDMADTHVETGDAVQWLSTRLTPFAGHVHMIYSTVAWQYLPQDAQAKGKALIEAAGNTATPDAPLAWATMETDGQTPGAALTLRLWPGDVTLNLGRADFHGRWIHWMHT